MLRHMVLRDFVIVRQLTVEFNAGFSVLTGETGAGKSILIDALQLALGSRGDAGVIREGAERAEIGACFDAPARLQPWLDEAGFSWEDELIVRRTIDLQGKSRAWINGSSATMTQLRELGDHLVDIHGQHAWQSLTRGDSVRELLDAFGSVSSAQLAQPWAQWSQAQQALERAQSQQKQLIEERERLLWQIAEVDKLHPGAQEWAQLNTDHTRLSNAHTLIEGAQRALQHAKDADVSAEGLMVDAMEALAEAAELDVELQPVADLMAASLAQWQDACRTLKNYLQNTELDPQRLTELDQRMSLWVSLSRRFKCIPEELAQIWQGWQVQLAELDAASDLEGLEKAERVAHAHLLQLAQKVSQQRQKAAPELSATVTKAMQALGMQGGRFEVVLTPHEDLHAYGLEGVEFRVAGHAGSSPKPLGKVASGGELSRISLAIAVCTSRLGEAGTLIFDEIDSGVGGAVAETVGRLMKQLGSDRQVLAVTHLPQVASCADHHYQVSKQTQDGKTFSAVAPIVGEVRVQEIARMLGGEHLSDASFAHAQDMLSQAGREGGRATGRVKGQTP